MTPPSFQHLYRSRFPSFAPFSSLPPLSLSLTPCFSTHPLTDYACLPSSLVISFSPSIRYPYHRTTPGVDASRVVATGSERSNLPGILLLSFTSFLIQPACLYFSLSALLHSLSLSLSLVSRLSLFIILLPLIWPIYVSACTLNLHTHRNIDTRLACLCDTGEVTGHRPVWMNMRFFSQHVPAYARSARVRLCADARYTCARAYR